MKSLNRIIEEQVQRWDLLRKESTTEVRRRPVFTFSREPGSGGKIVAQGVADKLQLDMFHQEVIHEMAKSARISERLVHSLDERRLSVLEDYISSIVHRQHLWPDEYLRHLLKIIGTIGKHGGAVVVGRGANFILPPESRFRVRVIAPRAFRAAKVAQNFDIALEEAERRIIKTGSDRKAFIRKYFNQDIADPLNYDLVINTGTLSIDEAVAAVCAAASVRG
jgi:cytidylate kinase